MDNTPNRPASAMLPADDRLEELTLLYVDRQLTREEVEELSQMLQHDEAARDRFCELMLQCRRLRELTPAARAIAVDASLPVARLATRHQKPPARRMSPMVRWAVAAMVLLACGVLTLVIYRNETGNLAGGAHGNHPGTVAVLSDLSNDARFIRDDSGHAEASGGGDGGQQQSRTLGADLAAGVFALKSGTAQLMFRSGAVVDLTGPCRFEMTDANRGRLTLGRLHAYVPPRAHGFTIDAPAGVSVTDLGTEFTVTVDAVGNAEVRVLEGRVRTQSASSPMRTLRIGEAVRVIDGSMRVVDDHAQLAQTDPQTRWQSYAQRLRDDPSLLAYYDFQNNTASGNQLADRTFVDVSHPLDAAVSGPSWEAGRFVGKQSLHFHGTQSGDHIEIPDAGGDRFDARGSFSVAVWCRVERFETDWQTLISKGDSAWRLQRFGHSDNVSLDTTSYSGAADSLASQTSINDGRWHLIVGTIDASGMRPLKRLYIDGRLEGERSVASIQTNTLPVWIASNVERPDRSFAGWIGELAIFQRTLEPAEINRMYNAGRPAAEPYHEFATETQ